MPRLTLAGVSRRFPSTPPVHALQNVTLTIGQGDFVAIEGPSGGGKSTLLNIVGLLDTPTAGHYEIGGICVDSSDHRQAAQLRSDYFGFIFQSFHLLDRRRVLDSVELGLLYRAVPREERISRSIEALTAVGLGNAVYQKANKLSGGERQRVAIARALATGAPIIVADEPTGNLDSENSQVVVDNLRKLHANGSTIVLVTHSPDVAAQAERRISLRDGRIVDFGSLTFERKPSLEVPWTDDPGTKIDLPPGAASTVLRRDIVRDAWANITSRAARTSGLVAAVAVAVALTVTTLGLSVSSRAQVADTFNAEVNREVSVQWSPGQLGYQSRMTRTSISARIAAMPGVQAAGVATSHDQHQVQASRVRATLSVPAYSIEGQVPLAARLDVEWIPQHPRSLAGGEVLIGTNLASQLELGPLEGGSRILLDGRVVSVVGIVLTSNRVPEYLGAVMASDADSTLLGHIQSVEALILTRAGAAQQVARRVPLVVDPAKPTALKITAPIDPTRLRQQVESSVQSTLVALTGIALLASIAGLTNAMMLAVMERRQELGLRRAVGARPRHIGALIFTESVVIGFFGGVIGLVGGLFAVFALTIIRHWTPVFDLRLAPAAVLGGIVIGVLGGLLASFRASHVQPSEALRL